MDIQQSAANAIRRSLDTLARLLRRRQRVSAGPRGRRRGFPDPGEGGGRYGDGGGWHGEGGAGVREPRRPLPTSGAGAAAATPSADALDGG
jgi:hypothetical protein